MFLSARAYGPTLAVGLGVERLWRISIATGIQITRLFDSDYRVKRQSGICLDRRSFGARTDRLFPVAGNWSAAADFNGDSNPDYVLYNASTRQTAIWYLNNNVYVGGGVWSNSSGRLGFGGCSGF